MGHGICDSIKSAVSGFEVEKLVIFARKLEHASDVTIRRCIRLADRRIKELERAPREKK